MHKLLILGLTLLLPSGEKGLESEHHAGPHHLEGWVQKAVVPGVDESPLPFTLVIAREGKVVRRFRGDSLLWAWMFQDDGRRIAVEEGPLHFALVCRLYDLRSGELLAEYDCFHDPVPPTAPAWVQALKSHAFSYPK